MARGHMIHRTDQVEYIKKLLKSGKSVFISSFFFSGKSVMLEQLHQSLWRQAVRYDAAKDDWASFVSAVKKAPDHYALLIDGMEKLTDKEQLNELAAMLADCTIGKHAVMMGRCQLPQELESLRANGLIETLGRNFVLFTEDEIDQLFQDYGLHLEQDDIAYLKEEGWGWPVMMHNIARRMLTEPWRKTPDMRREVAGEFWNIFIRDNVMTYPEPVRILLFNLAPFERFSRNMARLVTGRPDAPDVMNQISQRSYILIHEREGGYSFIPFVRNALMHELETRASPDHLREQYRRGALYYQLQGQTAEAARYYLLAKDTGKLRELLIHESQLRPSNGGFVDLKPAYAALPEQDVLASPELMKGLCVLESLCCNVRESERWYEELRRFIRSTP